MRPPFADLSHFLRRLAADFATRDAVVGERGCLTFAGLDTAADAWAAHFEAAGLGLNAHIGLLAGNGPEWLAAAFGVWRAGATLVPISTFVTTRELGQILAHADVDALIVQPQLRSHDYEEMVRSVPLPPTLRRVWGLKPARGEAFPTVINRSVVPERAVPEPSDASKLVGNASPLRKPAIDPESAACILYTSGTTGEPKGVMLSHRAVLATVVPTAERTGLMSDDILLSTLPLFWVAGLVIRALPTLATGCTLVFVETFTVDAVIAAMRRHHLTGVHLRPPQVGQILAHPELTPELLSNVRKGGGRAEWYAPHLREARLITGYGMTEMAGYVTALDWHDAADASGHLGTALPGVELRIVDGNGDACAPGQTGEIRVRGPGMFSGYYKQPAGSAVDANDFFITGDLGRIDAKGRLHFAGRTKDLVRVKGINVSPAEVESVLCTHAAVESAYVVGLPPDGLEQRLVALVVTRPGRTLTEAQLRAVAGEALSHYKRPDAYVFIERGAVPLSGTAKPQRLALAELATQRLSSSPHSNRTDSCSA